MSLRIASHTNVRHVELDQRKIPGLANSQGGAIPREKCSDSAKSRKMLADILDERNQRRDRR